MKKLILISSLIVFGFVLQAQDTLQGGSVLIVKDYEPTISDATKLNESPRVYDSLRMKKEEVQYSPLSKTIESNFKPTALKAAKLKGEPLEKLYNSYARLGVGLYASVKGTVQIHNLRSRKSNFGLSYHHHSASSNNTVKEASFAGYNHNRLELHGKRFFYNKILSGGVHYEGNVLHRYGVNPDTLTDLAKTYVRQQDIRQRYKSYGARMRFKSFYKDSAKVNFDLGGKVRYLDERFGTTELNTLIDGSLDRYIMGDFFAQVKGSFDYNDFIRPNANAVVDVLPQLQTTSLSHLGLSVEKSVEQIQAKAELKGFLEGDSTNRVLGQVRVFASYSMARNLIIPYVELSAGGVERTTFDQLRRQNNFLGSDQVLLNRKHLFRARGGVRGQFSRNTSFNLQADYDQIRNLPLFINDYRIIDGQNIANEFLVEYDTATVLNIRAEVSFEEIGKMNLYFRGDYYQYDLRNSLRAWHLPDFKVTIGGWYDLDDKLVFKGDLFVVSERFARTPNSWEGDFAATGIYEKKLPMLVDLNLSAEYRYSKRLGLYFELYNLLNSKYNLYNNYRIQGFTLMGGLSFSLFSR
jgi:hypothetical protein